MFKTISPKEVASAINEGSRLKVIDVREPQEFLLARVNIAEPFPMSSIAEWLPPLDPSEPVVVMCHHGVRSAYVCNILIANGFEDVSNMTGGIDLWSVEVDQAVPRY